MKARQSEIVLPKTDYVSSDKGLGASAVRCTSLNPNKEGGGESGRSDGIGRVLETQSVQKEQEEDAENISLDLSSMFEESEDQDGTSSETPTLLALSLLLRHLRISRA